MSKNKLTLIYVLAASLLMLLLAACGGGEPRVVDVEVTPVVEQPKPVDELNVVRIQATKVFDGQVIANSNIDGDQVLTFFTRQKTVVENGDGHIYLEPNNQSPIVATLSMGKIVTILEKTDNDYFLVETHDGSTGYVFSGRTHLDPKWGYNGPNGEFMSSHIREIDVTTTRSGKINVAPSEASPGVQVFQAGETFTALTETETGWYLIEASSGFSGYIRASDTNTSFPSEGIPFERNMVIVVAQGSFLYESPDQTSTTLRPLQLGEKASAWHEVGDGWFKVSLGGLFGYVPSKDVVLNNTPQNLAIPKSAYKHFKPLNS